MIKNKFYSLMTSAAVLTTLAGAPITAIIANADGAGLTHSSQTTQAEVEFTGVGNAKITTTTGGTDGTSGTADNNYALAPSFGFGKHALNGQAQTLNVEDSNLRSTTDGKVKYDTGHVLSITDNSGTGDGYNVSVQLGNFTSFDDAGNPTGHTLPSAILSVKAANAVASNTSAGTVDSTPTASSVDLIAGTSTAAGVVLTAAKGQGMGTYTTDLYTGTTLKVPNAQYAGNYVAPITYTVGNTAQP